MCGQLWSTDHAVHGVYSSQDKTFKKCLLQPIAVKDETKPALVKIYRSKYFGRCILGKLFRALENSF